MDQRPHHLAELVPPEHPRALRVRGPDRTRAVRYACPVDDAGRSPGPRRAAGGHLRPRAGPDQAADLSSRQGGPYRGPGRCDQGGPAPTAGAARAKVPTRRWTGWIGRSRPGRPSGCGRVSSAPRTCRRADLSQLLLTPIERLGGFVSGVGLACVFVTMTADPVPDLADRRSRIRVLELAQASAVRNSAGSRTRVTAVDDAVRIDRIGDPGTDQARCSRGAGGGDRPSSPGPRSPRSAGRGELPQARAGHRRADRAGLPPLRLARRPTAHAWPATWCRSCRRPWRAMASGQVSEHAAQLIGTETSHLDPDTRRQVDQQLAAAGLDRCRPSTQLRRLGGWPTPPTRKASLARAVKARKDRRVSCRPAPDTMAWLSALLPVEQAVACVRRATQGQRHRPRRRRSRGPEARSKPTCWWKGSPGKPRPTRCRWKCS